VAQNQEERKGQAIRSAVRGLILALLLPACDLPKYYYCQDHCWNFKKCLDSKIDIDPCIEDCIETIPISHIRSAMDIENCEYVDHYSARFSKTVDCPGDQPFLEQDGEVYDCYAYISSKN